MVRQHSKYEIILFCREKFIWTFFIISRLKIHLACLISFLPWEWIELECCYFWWVDIIPEMLCLFSDMEINEKHENSDVTAHISVVEYGEQSFSQGWSWPWCIFRYRKIFTSTPWSTIYCLQAVQTKFSKILIMLCLKI